MKPAFVFLILFCMFSAFPVSVNANDLVPIALHILSADSLNGTAGDFVQIKAEITNSSTHAANQITTYLSLVNINTYMPVDLEDWSAEKGLFIGTIEAGQVFPLNWKIHFVQPGRYALSLIAIIDGENKPVVSALTYFNVSQKRNLNPGNVLPIALGEPIAIVFIFLTLAYWGNSKRKKVV